MWQILRFMQDTKNVTEHETRNEQGEEGGWKSYTICVALDGQSVVDECLRLGAVATRTMKRLDGNQHRVPWPEYLELEWAEEVWKRLKNSRERESLTRTCDGPNAEHLSSFGSLLQDSPRQHQPHRHPTMHQLRDKEPHRHRQHHVEPAKPLQHD